MNPNIDLTANEFEEINRNLERIPLDLFLNDHTLVEIKEPYVAVEGRFAGYWPELKSLLLRKTIALRPEYIKFVDSKPIAKGDSIRLMLDEKNVARITKKQRVWENYLELYRILKVRGYLD